ncbi:hypothetical protein HOF56_02870 [Candidatus Peribacteria bacterium]|jgi:hypothetical protein|nr:hypothetical protein [Candidatus Peribacteria bacterium]MBT4021687.1 hypothetical protein [Candidatus Peribacteria bacterium]MBT4240849.1 hypothetical protein [Candidatus Peribacteria bacterium]MBT4473769.1 hypothetical protein [Candidatus Peribacteria bacterium]
MSIESFAYMIGIIELLIGIPLLVRPKETTKWIEKFMKEDHLMRTIGGLFLVVSFLILKDDPSVGTDIPGLIRLVAWLLAAKSLIMCWCPKCVEGVKKMWLRDADMQLLGGLLAIVVGVLLIMAGNTL